MLRVVGLALLLLLPVGGGMGCNDSKKDYIPTQLSKPPKAGPQAGPGMKPNRVRD